MLECVWQGVCTLDSSREAQPLREAAPCTYLVGVLEGNLETQDSQNQELTLHDAVSHLPEAGIQFQGFTPRVEIPMWEAAGHPKANESLNHPNSTLCCLSSQLSCSGKQQTWAWCTRVYPTPLYLAHMHRKKIPL